MQAPDEADMPVEQDESGQHPGNVAGFFLILVQLALVVAVVDKFNVERSDQQHTFLRLLCVMIAGFAVHVWLPRSLRMGFFALLSCASVLLYLELRSGLMVLGLGAILIAVGMLPVRLLVRLILLAVITGLLAWVRLLRETPLIEGIPGSVWPVLGSMFMFRLALWIYDNHQTKKRPPAATTIAYFFMVPNVHFPMFPVVDFRRFRETWYDSDQWEICQRGVGWIVRGIVHLLLYRYINARLVPESWQLVDLPHIAQFMVTNYALYLHVSGHFHLITGLLHLFGFNLPRTHHNFFFASSFSDIWRRINIYWKDFMAKLFFFPVFHAVRRRGGTTTISILTGVACVFVSTWLLHSWQTFWLLGVPRVTVLEAGLWLGAGACVAVNSLLDARRRGRTRRPAVVEAVIHSARVVGMFTLVSLFWALWSTGDFPERLMSAIRRPGAFEGLMFVLSVAGVLIVVGAVMRLIQTLRESQQVADRPFRFRDSALLQIAGLGLAVAFAVPEVNGILGSRAQEMIADLQKDETDAARQIQGYYEDLNTASIQAGTLLATFSPHDETRRQQAYGFSKVVVEADDYQVVDLKPGMRTELGGNEFSVNRYGLRDRETITLDKPAGTRRIAFVGSSIVMGYGVDDDTVFSRQVENRLNASGDRKARFEILNFGVGRQWSTHRLVRIQRKVFNFEPDAVYYFAHQDEFETLAAHAAKLLTKGLDMPTPYLNDVLAAVGVRSDMPPGLVTSRLSSRQSDMLTAVYRQLADDCRKRNVLPVWIYLPVPNADEDPEAELTAIASNAGMIVCDLNDWWGSHNPADLFPGHDEHHPNATGHRLITDAILKLMDSRPDIVPE